VRAYPENVIYVIFLSLDNDVMFQISKSLYGLSYRNIILTKLNVPEFIASTALKFPHDEFLSNSKHQYKHTLDIIRLILLYKYGGTYIDSEMIVRKNLSHVKNFLCDEGFYAIRDSVINFDQRERVEVLLEDMIKNFDGNIEDQQGSILLTRVMEKLCQSPRVKMKKDRRNCEGYNILNKEVCYPVDSTSYWKLFEESEKEIALEMISNSSIVHLFNPLSKTITKSADTAATKLMMEFCPNTFGLAEEFDFMEFT
jgi:lactosylceramide 4-alpha-galactosyltransferase